MKRLLHPYHLAAIQHKSQQTHHVHRTVERVYVSLAMCCYSDKGQTDSPLEANDSLRKCAVKHVSRFIKKKLGAF